MDMGAYRGLGRVSQEHGDKAVRLLDGKHNAASLLRLPGSIGFDIQDGLMAV
jgi:hypothetical protein